MLEEPLSEPQTEHAPSYLDTPVDREYPRYTRASAVEMLPEPLSPLAWSIIGPALEEGFRIALCDDLGLYPRPRLERPYWAVGRHDSRFQLNLTVMRTAGDRLPGLSAGAIDEQWFGSGEGGVAEHVPHPDDRRFRRRSPASVGRTLAGISRRVNRDRAGITEWDDVIHPVLQEGSAVDVVHHLRLTVARTALVVGTHITARTLTASLVSQALAAMRRAGIDDSSALELLGAVPDIETSRPARRLAEIASTVTPGSGLHRALSTGSLRSAEAAGAADLADRIDTFIADFGHRGQSEFDPTQPVWEQNPADVVRILDALVPVTPSPTIANETNGVVGSHGEATEPETDPGRVARPLVGAARSAIARAERTRDNASRATNQLRRLVFALRSPVSRDIDATWFRMYTIDEIEAVVHGGSSPMVSELRRRSDEFSSAADDQPGGRVTENEIGPGSVTLHGATASPGVVAGPARVMKRPTGPIAEGEILVTSFADTAWTPFLIAAGGLVTDVGSMLSHIAVVARDLGVPALVNTGSATEVIRTGDLVEIDTGTGEVRVTKRA